VTFRPAFRISSTATPGRIGNSRCGWHGHEQPSRHPISQIGLAEQDNEKAQLLRRIADEADRGVLFTVEHSRHDKIQIPINPSGKND
jgi:hypothetical protein